MGQTEEAMVTARHAVGLDRLYTLQMNYTFDSLPPLALSRAELCSIQALAQYLLDDGMRSFPAGEAVSARSTGMCES